MRTPIRQRWPSVWNGDSLLGTSADTLAESKWSDWAHDSQPGHRAEVDIGPLRRLSPEGQADVIRPAGLLLRTAL